MSDHESFKNTDFGVTDKFQQVREFINMESANSENQTIFKLLGLPMFPD